MKKETVEGGKGVSQTVCRSFKNIYEQERTNLVKKEFKTLRLKNEIKLDDQYLLNINNIKPLKNELISSNYENSLMWNRIGNQDARGMNECLDEDFGMMWHSTMWNHNLPFKQDRKYKPYSMRGS